MENIKILWIDDDLKTQTNTSLTDDNPSFFLELVKALNKQFHIEWTFSNRIGDGNTFMDTYNYDLVFVDLTFTDERNFSSEQLRRKLNNKKIPFIILSMYIDGLNDVNDSNNFYMLHKERKVNDKIEEIIEVIECYIHYPTVKILQVSDLHLGLDYKASYQKEQETIFTRLIDFVSDRVDIVLLNGDYADKNPKEELKAISKYILKLIEKTVGKNNFDRVLLIPGNHDILWDNYIDKKLSKDPWACYSHFILDIYQSCNQDDKSEIFGTMGIWNSESGRIETQGVKGRDLSWRRKIDRYKLDIIGISSISENPEDQGNGIFSKDASEFIDSQWNDDSNDGFLRIIVIHHNLFPSITENKIEEKNNITDSGDLIKLSMRKGCNLILSGHSHFSSIIKFASLNMNDNNRNSSFREIINISCGTSGGYGATYDTNRSFNFIEIMGTINKAKVKITSNIYDSNNQKWFEWNSVIISLS